MMKIEKGMQPSMTVVRLKSVVGLGNPESM